MGANAITVQGGEGRPYRQRSPTTVLLPQVVDAVDVPVIAAGGFMTAVACWLLWPMAHRVLPWARGS